MPLTHSAFPLAIGAVLIGCAVLFAIAALRHWSVPLWGAVGTALAVRLAVAGLSYGHTPHDVATYFRHAGELVLAGQDPATTLPRFQWNFLPLMPYVYALQIRTGLPWEIGGKIAPVVADVVIVALLPRLAPKETTVPLLYALCPVAILVSAEHGQVEPVALALGIGALVLARRQAAARSGLLAGLAVATKTWPALLVLGMLRETPWRRWWRLLLPLIAVLAVMLATVKLFLHTSLQTFTHVLASYRSFLGLWGWTGMLHYFGITGVGYQGPNIDPFQRIGTIALAAAMIAVVVLFWRTGGVALTAAALLAFLIVTAGFGPQYLLWPIPFVLALRRPSGLIFTITASCYAAFAYLTAIPNPQSAAWTDPWQEWLSIPVIISALIALPWALRREAENQPAGSGASKSPRSENTKTRTA